MPRQPPKGKERPDPEGPNRASGPASTLTLNWALPGWPLGLGHICDVITPTRAVVNKGRAADPPFSSSRTSHLTSSANPALFKTL